MEEGAPGSEPRNGLALQGGAQQAQGGSGSCKTGLFQGGSPVGTLPSPNWSDPSVTCLGLAEQGQRALGAIQGPGSQARWRALGHPGSGWYP